MRLYDIMRAMCWYISKKPILYVDRISESKHVERSSGKKGRSPSRVEKSSSYRSTRRMYPDYYLHFTSNVYCILMSGKSKLCITYYSSNQKITLLKFNICSVAKCVPYRFSKSKVPPNGKGCG